MIDREGEFSTLVAQRHAPKIFEVLTMAYKEEIMVYGGANHEKLRFGEILLPP